MRLPGQLSAELYFTFVSLFLSQLISLNFSLFLQYYIFETPFILPRCPSVEVNTGPVTVRCHLQQLGKYSTSPAVEYSILPKPVQYSTEQSRTDVVSHNLVIIIIFMTLYIALNRQSYKRLNIRFFGTCS
jgi:hypothetical protein